ncbi:IS1634 family transposase [Streptobacillus ratti]|uniref:IS1634 family transposase n=1 Tax=Streptobacillus ratti TaxID=1720557 RepID=UPI0009330C64|nr:IS1634 family transposase [Streptobacillus ratti]
MHLTFTKAGNNIHIYAKRKFIDPKSKKLVTKTVCKVGVVENQDKLTDEQKLYFKNIIDDLNKKEAENNNNIIVNEINLNQTISINDINSRKNLGSLFISFVFDKLNLSNILYPLKDNKEYSLAQIFRFLVYTRLIFQGSKLDNIEHINSFIDLFNFKLHDIYRALRVFAKNKVKIINGIHEFLSHNFKIDKTFTHYDVTNYYIYTDNTNEDNYPQYGYSKINNDKPIVQMGLITDRNGIPLTYKLFKGNKTDVSTLIPFIDEAKKEFDFSKTVVIADAGLISSNNIAQLLVSNNSYILKDRIRNMSSDLKKIFENTIRDALINASKEDLDKGIRKVYTYGISIANNKRVITTINEEKKTISLNERFVFYYSPKYQKLAEFSRENIQVVNSLTGEIIESDLDIFKEYELNEEFIDKDSKYDGFSLIVTNLDPKENIDYFVLSTYAKQYQIEHVFRATKTLLKARPIFVSTDDAIEGHFLTCFVSLLILMLIRQKLKNRYSLDTILETLKEHNYIYTHENIYTIDTTKLNECLFDLYKSFRLGDINKYHTPQTLKNILAKTRK